MHSAYASDSINANQFEKEKFKVLSCGKLFIGLKWLSARKTAVNFVPPFDLVAFAELPA